MGAAPHGKVISVGSHMFLTRTDTQLTDPTGDELDSDDEVEVISLLTE